MPHSRLWSSATLASSSGQFAPGTVQGLSITTGNGQNTVVIDPSVLQPAIVHLGDGGDIVFAGGGPTTVLGGAGNDKIYAGSAPDLLDGGGGTNQFFEVKQSDTRGEPAGRPRLLRLIAADSGRHARPQHGLVHQ